MCVVGQAFFPELLGDKEPPLKSWEYGFKVSRNQTLQQYSVNIWWGGWLDSYGSFLDKSFIYPLRDGGKKQIKACFLPCKEGCLAGWTDSGQGENRWVCLNFTLCLPFQVLVTLCFYLHSGIQPELLLPSWLPTFWKCITWPASSSSSSSYLTTAKAISKCGAHSICRALRFTCLIHFSKHAMR